MNSRLIEPRACAWCGQFFTPRTPEQKYCPRKVSDCAAKAIGARYKGRRDIVAAACSVRRRMHLEKVKGMTPAQAYRAGYTAAYNKLYAYIHRLARQAAEKVA